MPILDSVASNVESTLAFTLSVKLVDIVGNLRGGGNGKGRGDPRDATLFLCIGILFLSAAPAFVSTFSSPSKQTQAASKRGSMLQQALASAARVSRDLTSLAGEVVLLAFSRLVMQQVVPRQVLFH